MSSLKVFSQSDIIVDDPAFSPDLICYTNIGLKSGQVNKTIRLWVIFSNSTPGGAPLDTPTNLNLVLDGVGASFSQLGLTYELVGHEQVTQGNMNLSQFYSTNPILHPGEYVIIIVPSIAGGYSGSGAMGYPCSKFDDNVLSYSQSSKRAVFAHEIGHNLGLYHTCYGTRWMSECPGLQGERNSSCVLLNYGLPQIPELVNGSNSASSGDYITDTPADPVNYNKTDANGQSYVYPFFNTMEYVMDPNDPNPLTFTPNQLKAEQNVLESPVYYRVYSKSISGPNLVIIGSPGTFTYVDGAPVDHKIGTPVWSCTNNTAANGVSINPSTGILTVNTSLVGVETVTCQSHAPEEKTITYTPQCKLQNKLVLTGNPQPLL